MDFLNTWCLIDKKLNFINDDHIEENMIPNVVKFIKKELNTIQDTLCNVENLNNYSTRRGCMYTKLYIEDFFNYNISDKKFKINWEFVYDLQYKNIGRDISNYNLGFQNVFCIEIIIKNGYKPLIISKIFNNIHINNLKKDMKENIIDEPNNFLIPKAKNFGKRCCVCRKFYYNIKLCSRCMCSKYCSRTCQIKDYKIHKEICIEISNFLFHI